MAEPIDLPFGMVNVVSLVQIIQFNRDGDVDLSQITYGTLVAVVTTVTEVSRDTAVHWCPVSYTHLTLPTILRV